MQPGQLWPCGHGDHGGQKGEDVESLDTDHGGQGGGDDEKAEGGQRKYWKICIEDGADDQVGEDDERWDGGQGK